MLKDSNSWTLMLTGCVEYEMWIFSCLFLVCGVVGAVNVAQVDAERIIIHASSETKEYWVPREHVTLGVQDTDTIGYLIDQLCYIFHRSRKMASHKESYPCKSRSMSLMLYNPYSKAEYKNTRSTLKAYKITNGTTLYLYYS